MRLNKPQRSLVLLAAGLAACIGMLVLRYALFGRWYRGYLAWNLFLACIPLVIALAALWVERRNQRLIGLPALAGFSFLWLLFFPNSSYIFTDFIHLIQRGFFIQDPNARGMDKMWMWFDLINSSLFAFVGHLLGLASLYIVHHLWKKEFGQWTAWALVGGACVAAGYGVFVGRFVRWNSWHLFTHPEEVWTTITGEFLAPDSLVFTAAFSVFLLVSYFFFYVNKKHLFVPKETL